MKTVGIIGAMEEEIDILKSKIEMVAAKNIVGVDFYMGKLHGKNIIIVRSGIGKVNAAICTQVLIDMYGVDYVINTGVAGSISKELEIGDIVVSDDLVYHDFDTTAVGDQIGVIPRMSCSFFKADEELIRIAKETSKTVLDKNKMYVGRIASGDQFVASKETKAHIWNNFKAYCVEMEGAAIAHTCFLNKIPFVVIRSISDKADSKATVSFDTFVKMAAKKSSDIVEEMLNLL